MDQKINLKFFKIFWTEGLGSITATNLSFCSNISICKTTFVVHAYSYTGSKQILEQFTNLKKAKEYVEQLHKSVLKNLISQHVFTENPNIILNFKGN